MKKGKVGLISLVCIIVAAIIVISSLIVTVPTGYVAVKYSMNGGVKGDYYTQGWHIKSPSVKTTDIPLV